MADKINLCAKVPLDLIERVRAERERLGMSNGEYVTMLLREYYEYKENGGGNMDNNGKTRTLAFQISDDLFNRIKEYLDRESARSGKRVTQREFVIGLIVAALDEADRKADRTSAATENGQSGTEMAGNDQSNDGESAESQPEDVWEADSEAGVAPGEDAGPVYGPPAPEDLNAATDGV